MKNGKVLQVGSPKEIYNCPNQEFVANFVGVSNRLGDSFVRPEHLVLCREETNGIPVKVTSVRFAGVYYEYTVQSSDAEYRVIEINRGNEFAEWQVNDTGWLVVAHEK